MATFAENVARLRVARETGQIPADVAAWALEVIGEQGPAAAAIERRNILLREAAALVSGSRWAKARRLEREVQALSMRPGMRERAADDGVRAVVALALAAGPAPTSVRQLLRILGE